MQIQLKILVTGKKKKKLKSPLFFISTATAAKFVLPIPIFFGLSRSTRCGCDRKHYCKNLWSWSEFKIFCTLVTMATATILNFFNPQKLPHTTVDIPTKFDERNPTFFLIPPFLFPWQLRQSLSNRFWFFWIISFH